MASDQVNATLDSVADPVFLLQALFAEAPIATAIVDHGGRCVAVNRRFCALFGAPPPPDDTVVQDELIMLQGLAPHIRRALTGEAIGVPVFWYEPRELPYADGSLGNSAPRRRVAIELTITPIRDRDGIARHVAMHYRDVTAVQELAERQRTAPERALLEHDVRIREAHRLKNEFLAAMSHELRTPLNTIIGFSELVFYGRVAPGTTEHHEFIGDILASSRHLLQVINNVLDLATVEAGKLELHPEPLQIASAFSEVSSVLRTLSLQKRIHVELELDSSLEPVVLDPTRFKQVLYNYLSNAIKFTPEGGHVIVRVLPETPEQFRVEVEDTGVGIAPDDLAQIFRGAERQLAEVPLGPGLGLALTRRIVEAQGGTVGARSAVGRGSVFYAILPRRMSQGAVAAAR